MQLKQRDIKTIFNKLDMKIREGRDTLAFFYYKGQKTRIFTRVPHKKGDLKGKLTSFIRQQLKLNEDQFINLKKCPLTKEGYIEILKSKNIL